MLTFKPIRNIFFLCLSLIFVADIAGLPIQAWHYLILISIFILFIIIAAFNIQLNVFLPAQNQLSTSAKEIALTFDDGPCPINTPEILNVLAKYQVKATFFCIGKAIEASPELFCRIIREGHAVGNHTYSHSNIFPLYLPKKMRMEIEHTNTLIQQYTQAENVLFRPPFGVTNPGIARAVKRLGMCGIGWKIRSYDTSNRTPETICANIKRQLVPGAIILFHDNRPATAQILDEFLQYVQQQAYACVRIPNIKHAKS